MSIIEEGAVKVFLFPLFGYASESCQEFVFYSLRFDGSTLFLIGSSDSAVLSMLFF